MERAQQKLKLDAMVVQQGRLKDQDNKLSRDELLEAIRFGADKIFKSKDSSITDDDVSTSPLTWHADQQICQLNFIHFYLLDWLDFRCRKEEDTRA